MGNYFHKVLWWGLVIASVGALFSCASLPKQEAMPDSDRLWRQHFRQISTLQSWDASGRIAIRSPSKGVSGGFQWVQNMEDYVVQLRDPFGRTLAIVEVDAQGVVFSQAGLQSVHASDPDRLFAQLTGYAVPVAALHYWLRGMPLPKQGYQHELDGLGRLARLQQLGWTLEYSRYQSVDGVDLPVKITAVGKGLTLRFIVSNWQLDLI